jgi:hypothetical protein
MAAGIVTAVVLAVQACAVWATAKVSKEYFEAVSPSGADFDASPTIARVVDSALIETSMFHRLPGLVFGSSTVSARMSVPAIEVTGALCRPAPTGFALAAPHLGNLFSPLRTAFASDIAERAAIGCQRRGNNRPAIESITNDNHVSHERNVVLPT